MTPDQYRREGAEAMQEAAALAAEDRTPSKHGGALASHVTGMLIQNAIRAIDPAEVLAEMRPRCAECDCEDGKCTWIKAGPDAVARLVEAANQARMAFAGYVSAQSAINKLDEALAAMETNHD